MQERRDPGKGTSPVKISRLSAAKRTELEAGKNYAQGKALGR